MPFQKCFESDIQEYKFFKYIFPVGKHVPTIKELTQYVTVAAHWNRFAIFLVNNKNMQRVYAIQHDPAYPRSEEKLDQVFQIFLSDDPTWEAVVEALEGINQNYLARVIRERFC